LVIRENDRRPGSTGQRNQPVPSGNRVAGFACSHESTPSNTKDLSPFGSRHR
jgi:hypothetical protein